MDLSQFRTLIQVAELGSLSKAADRLRIAQPALSRQIKLLEEELGARLFDRHGRGMVLTDAGREVRERVARIMSEVDEMRASVPETNAVLTGRVAVGLPPTVAEIVSVPLVAAFRRDHPRVELRFICAFTGYLLDWLQRGEIDVAVLYDPAATRSLRSRPLLIENLLLVAPSEQGLSLARAVPFARLEAETLLLPSGRHGLRTIVERCAADAGIALKVGIESDSLHTLKDLVRHGYGRTILPLAPIHGSVLAGSLSAAPLVEPTPSRRLVLSFSRDRPVLRAARFAAEAITEIVTDLVRRDVWAGHLVDGGAEGPDGDSRS